MNSRHPDPRRVLGRCRAAVRGPDPVDPLDPGMKSFLRALGVNSSKMEPGDAPVQCFFDFFTTAPSQTPSFEGGTPPGDSRLIGTTYIYTQVEIDWDDINIHAGRDRLGRHKYTHRSRLIGTTYIYTQVEIDWDDIHIQTGRD